jgi:hypothetical protein
LSIPGKGGENGGLYQRSRTPETLTSVILEEMTTDLKLKVYERKN